VQRKGDVLFVVALASCLMAACRPGSEAPAVSAERVLRFQDDGPSRPQASERGDIVVRELLGGLSHPWGLAFLPDGAMLVTERPGRLHRIAADGTITTLLDEVPRLFMRGQSGVLDVAVSPQFVEDRLVYVSYGESNLRGNKGGTAVARARLEGDRLGTLEVIFRQEPKLSNSSHIGSRLAFDDRGYLFVSAGDNRDSGKAQLLDHLQGKVVRLHPDGRIPNDNPFVGRADARAEIWSYGHRNIQGMAMHPTSGQVWTHEHGPFGGDEINLVQAGLNYGWPLATHGREYSGEKVPEAIGTHAPGTQPPHHYWQVSPALSGMAFYTGEVFPQWRGNLFIGAMAGQRLIRLELDGDRIVHEEGLLADLGERIRDVRMGPDGYLYLLTDDAANGRLLRLEPAAAMSSGEGPAVEAPARDQPGVEAAEKPAA
jgi:glucose/arabinose dehydrogenase